MIHYSPEIDWIRDAVRCGCSYRYSIVIDDGDMMERHKAYPNRRDPDVIDNFYLKLFVGAEHIRGFGYHDSFYNAYVCRTFIVCTNDDDLGIEWKLRYG